MDECLAIIIHLAIYMAYMVDIVIYIGTIVLLKIGFQNSIVDFSKDVLIGVVV